MGGKKQKKKSISNRNNQFSFYAILKKYLFLPLQIGSKIIKYVVCVCVCVYIQDSIHLMGVKLDTHTIWHLELLCSMLDDWQHQLSWCPDICGSIYGKSK